jgi:hypothetical protein
MRTVVTRLKSISPYSQSRKVQTPRGERETAADHETRCWRERCHVNNDGHLFIPPMAFKNCLSEAAKYMSLQIPGKGKSTYTKHIEAGVLVLDGLILPETLETVQGEWLFVPSDGRRGSGKRVDKCFPFIPTWEGEVTWHILDEVITESVFKHHITESGNFIGVGRFRPRNNGFYGRFQVLDIKWL